ncbi:hypothetical protein COO60DRAFT_73887 [Scenedesmus sp. NREL 46B-D3]|nr:hypothetical protein COO60DRAFT_73887 [Scenedesmus sp. NREL 46B-D3]
MQTLRKPDAQTAACNVTGNPASEPYWQLAPLHSSSQRACGYQFTKPFYQRRATGPPAKEPNKAHGVTYLQHITHSVKNNAANPCTHMACICTRTRCTHPQRITAALQEHRASTHLPRSAGSSSRYLQQVAAAADMRGPRLVKCAETHRRNFIHVRAHTRIQSMPVTETYSCWLLCIKLHLLGDLQPCATLTIGALHKCVRHCHCKSPKKRMRCHCSKCCMCCACMVSWP